MTDMIDGQAQDDAAARHREVPDPPDPVDYAEWDAQWPDTPIGEE